MLVKPDVSETFWTKKVIIVNLYTVDRESKI